MKIDAHHHFWTYNADEFGWLGGPMDALRRDFGPADLKPTLDASGIDSVVSVESRQKEIETEALLAYADAHAWIAGVVGYVTLERDDVTAAFERFISRPKFRGVRKVVQGMPVGALLDGAFNRGVSKLAPLNLVYDLLIFARQLQEAAEFVDRHPQQVFVLDHVAKPDIAGGGFDAWSNDLQDLARRENVYCKISGMATEADWAAWTPGGLRPYFDVALQAFGPRRLMFGSDWPVCLVATSYPRWVNTVADWTATLSVSEQASIWGGTAIEAYGLFKQPSSSNVVETIR